RRADAFDFVRTGLAAFEYRSLRLDDDAVNGRQSLAQKFRDARECPAGSRAGDERIDAAVHLLENLRPGRLVMRFGVVDVDELLRDVRVRNLLRQLLGAFDRALHAVVFRRELHFAAEGAHDFAFLDREVFGNAQNHAITHAHADEREADAGVARGRLDDR